MRTAWTQPFHWGLLTASDPASTGLLPSPHGTHGIGGSDVGLVVPVLHSADVETPEDWPADQPIPEATVTVTVLVDEPDEPDDGASPEFEAVLQCPSGRLAVGDPDHERMVVVPRGRVRVRVTRVPAEFAEQVTLRVDAAPD